MPNPILSADLLHRFGPVYAIFTDKSKSENKFLYMPHICKTNPEKLSLSKL